MSEEAVATYQVKTTGVEQIVGLLSGGNRQKVAFAKWLATKPRVLLLDEPTHGIDVGSKAQVHRIIAELADSGLAILMISSDLPEVLAMSDRILVIAEGELVAELDSAAADQEKVMLAATRTPDGDGACLSRARRRRRSRAGSGASRSASGSAASSPSCCCSARSSRCSTPHFLTAAEPERDRLQRRDPVDRRGGPGGGALHAQPRRLGRVDHGLRRLPHGRLRRAESRGSGRSSS